MKALVVDDSAVMRKIMVKALAEAGFTEVDEAPTGDQGLSLLQAGDYGLILIDWNMPGMSGLETVGKIRAAGKTIPIIMVTSESDRAHVVEAIRRGVDNYLIKPFERVNLVRKIHETMKGVREGSRRIRRPEAPPAKEDSVR